MQLLEPLAVHDIGLAARDVFHVMGVDEHHVEAAGLQDLVEGDPVDAGGFHGYGGDAADREPVREAVELRRHGRERAHRGRVSADRDGDVMLGGPAIDAGGIRLNALQE